jgi:hypothetical protein
MNQDVIYEDVTETAKKIRKYLKKEYPNHKFGVSIERFAGGNSVRVKLKEPFIDDFRELGRFEGEISQDLDKFRSFESDVMRDCMVPGHYEYEGKKYQGAMFIQVQSI